MKNIDKRTVLNLASLIAYQDGQIVSKTLSQNNNVTLTLFSFDIDEEIGTHSSSGDALVQILEGSAKVSIDDVTYTLQEGQAIILPAAVPHSVYALTKFKMLLTVIF